MRGGKFSIDSWFFNVERYLKHEEHPERRIRWTGSTTMSSGYSTSCRGFELARCTSEGLLMRKVDFESDSRHLRVIAKLAGRISFGERFRVFDRRIPRHVVSLHEQYLRQYLEWVLGKASKVMPFDSPLALTASSSDGNSELRRSLAVKRTSGHESMNSYADAVAATDMKSISWIDEHRLQSLPMQLTDMKSADWAGVLSSGRSSNSTAAGSLLQGMLVFGWMDGMPHFVFSLDEQREVYIADLTRITSSDCIDPDYKYSIRMNEHGLKERAFNEGCDFHVGEIYVATLISVCSNVSEIRTTEFVLLGGYKIPVEEERGDQTRKNKGLPKKAGKAFPFKSRRSSKRRSSTLCQNGISEDFSTESRQDKVTVLESYRHPHNELAAIVVKGSMKGTATERKQEAGGWGLKFLRKIEAASSKECSERMNVIIPAGLHGGPRTVSGGASSLIERWKSGGKCDCGGWDLGCPLALLEAWSTEPVGYLRSVDLVDRGSNTALRMTNVRDGLFLIRFDRSLSALQALSVAVAYVHTHSPLLRQRLRRS